jgi:formate hydrogenlyase subunit 3/multisubunit Na+/H+ antiporter MnhD subunit
MNSSRSLERIVGSVVIGVFMAFLAFFVSMSLLISFGLRAGLWRLHLFEPRYYPPDPYLEFAFFGGLIVGCFVLLVVILRGARLGKTNTTRLTL